MAPEMISGEAIDHRIDIFALGVVLYALTTGKMPFEGQTYTELLRRIVREPPPPPRSVNARIPIEIEQVILRALEKDPARRYPHASELQRELESYMVRTSSVIAPYQLAQFMSNLYPPGTDRNREAYQQMMGVAPAPSDDLTEMSTLLESVNAIAERRSDGSEQPTLERTTQLEPDVETTPGPLRPIPDPASAVTIALPSAPTALFAVSAPSTSFSASGIGARPSGGRLAIGLAAVAIAVAMLVGGGAFFYWIQRPEGGPPPSHELAPPRDAARTQADVARPREERGGRDAASRSPDAAPAVAPGLEEPRKAPAEKRIASRNGRLKILVWPYGTVTLDGKSLGATPLPTQILPEGPHHLLIENRELKQKRTIQVSIKGGREAVVKIKFDPPEEAR
jgi:serine/threonine-protein kinase